MLRRDGGAHEQHRDRRRVRIPFATPRRRLIHPALGMLTTWVTSLVGMLPTLFLVLRSNGTGYDHLMIVRSALVAVTSLAAIFGLYPLLKRIARAPELTIGDDGIVYTAGRRTRSIPRAKIEGVDQPHPMMATTIRNDGAPIIILGTGIDGDRRAAATWLLRERMQAPAPVNGTHFGRGGRIDLRGAS